MDPVQVCAIKHPISPPRVAAPASLYSRPVNRILLAYRITGRGGIFRKQCELRSDSQRSYQVRYLECLGRHLLTFGIPGLFTIALFDSAAIPIVGGPEGLVILLA